MFTLTRQPMSVKQIFSTSCYLYKHSFKTQFPLVILLALIANVLAFVDVTLPDAWHVLVTILIVALGTFFHIALVHRVNGVLHGVHALSQMSLKIAQQKWLPGLGLVALTLIPIVLGFVLFLLPGVFLYVLLFFVFPCFVLKNTSIIESIKLSCHLVWGNWWRIFGILLFMILIPLGIIEIISALTVGHGVAMLGHGILQVLLFVAFYPWLYSVMLVLFHDLQERAQKNSNHLNQPAE